MITNHNTALSESLSLLTYNGGEICTPQDKQLNLFIGIGLWSKKDKLSTGLPIDVLQMLLAAAILRLKIVKENPLKSSTIIVLIADSMAEREGAEKVRVQHIANIYQRCLDSLLSLLNIKGNTQIILSSELEKDPRYQAAFKMITQTDALKEYANDQQHYGYICAQTAITHMMSLYEDVGIKVGWIKKASKKALLNHSLDQLKDWDELKFDSICKASGCPMQYLYTKAGLKILEKGNTMEGCPYTAYQGHDRYVINHDITKLIVVKKPPTSIVRHWSPIVKACKLIECENTSFLPKVLHKSNDVAAVQQCLNYWINALSPPMKVQEESKASI